MSNLQSLIDRLGTPPPEICLDWALQLANLGHVCEARSGHEHGNCGKAQASTVAWRDLTIDRDGRLELLPHASVSMTTLEPLIDSLLEWSSQSPNREQDATELPAEHAPSDTIHTASWPLRRRLEQRSLQLATQVNLPEQSAEQSAEPSEEPSSGGGRFELEPQSPGVSRTPSPEVPRSRLGQEKRPKSNKPTRMLFTAASILGLIAVTTAVAFLDFSSGPNVANRSKSHLSRQSPPPGNQAFTGATEPDQTPDEEPIEGIALANSTDSLARSSGANRPLLDDVVSSISLTTNGDSMTDPMQSLSQQALREQHLEAKAEVDPLSISNAKFLAPSELKLSQIAEAESIDVLAEFTDMSQSVEKQTSDTLIPTDVLPNDSEQRSRPHPPLAITTFPILQVQRLDMEARVRKPLWTLRLETSEGFEVSPSEPQSLAGREMATWIIHEPQASDPKTQVFVQVQLSGNRSPALRWRVAANATDVPQVAVPLEMKSLDRLQLVLKQRRQLLQLEVDRLRQMASVDGVPGDLRSAMSASRRIYEQQGQLAERLLEIMADAVQFEGWLDGQIAVHAELRDVASADSTPLLQFGVMSPAEVDGPEAGGPATGN
jgi:hypothetical protein